MAADSLAEPVRFQKSVTYVEQQFHAARSYSLIKPVGAESVIHVMRPGHIRGSDRRAGRGFGVACRAVVGLGEWYEWCCLVQRTG
jgi:hypothetical protein